MRIYVHTTLFKCFVSTGYYKFDYVSWLHIKLNMNFSIEPDKEILFA